VIADRGLLAVHVNGIRHHQTRQPDALGLNPLAFMAVGKVQPSRPSALFGRTTLSALLSTETPQYYLFEWKGQGWVRYRDYTRPVKLPKYLADPAAGYVMPLLTGTVTHDFANEDGHKNLGSWIDRAAQQVGR
jgi:hypothetical protein